MNNDVSKLQDIGMFKQSHLNRQIPPLAHTPMYNWHKFWARKTWNVVGEFIKTYSKEGEIVFDPFAGSGVTAIEALRNNRRAIVCDLLPIATEIIRLTIKPVSETELFEAFELIEKKVKDKILNLYRTNCRNCRKEINFNCAIWNKSRCIEIRYQVCPYCGDRRGKETDLIINDIQLLKEIENNEIKEWYPNNPLYYPNGIPFKKKEKYESLSDLFTKRNLQALAWLMEAIEGESNKLLRDFLKIGFTSMVHLCTKMCPISEKGHFTPFSSFWNQQSYWSAPIFMEQNVWLKFESAIMGPQGLLRAKKESNSHFKEVKFARDYQEVIDNKSDIYIHTGSSLELMKKMPKGTIDYIFTDPPYDSSIQYGELAYLWVAWLKMDKSYLDSIVSCHAFNVG